MRHIFSKILKLNVFVFSVMFSLAAVGPATAQSQITAFGQALAEASSSDPDIVSFYRTRRFVGLWTGPEDHARREALLAAFLSAEDHGLPANRYDPALVTALFESATTQANRARADVELTRLFLRYARDLQTGILIPREVDRNIRREVPYRLAEKTLANFAAAAQPATFMRTLAPSSPEYTRLMREKLAMERLVARGGWGPTVPGRKLQRGDTGLRVVALRNRLIAMGFLPRTNLQTYDATMVDAVRRFQEAHGLAIDGTAGPGTLAMVNVPAERRLQAIIVAMERERWINRPRGDRHIWVNLTDFTAKIIDHEVETFTTRSVIGANEQDRLSPEFSDVMEFMVINPSWYVPRSIATKEYLPQLRRNRFAQSQLILTDRRGRQVNRNNVDFSQYTASNFPYAMRQPPSRGNALGLVKFMFPNPYNIYLHDTPAKSLFGREVRAFSHGCIRLNDPFDFAYALLAKQEVDPEGFFQTTLRTGQETQVDLIEPVPVHLVYRTAFTQADGQMQYRRDVYGRDARIWDALAREGVVIRAVRG